MRIVRRLAVGIVAFVVLSAVSGLIVRSRVRGFGSTEDDQWKIVAAMDGAEFSATSQSFEAGEVLAQDVRRLPAQVR